MRTNYLMIGLLLLRLTMPVILRPLHDASPSAYRPAPGDATRFQALVTFVAEQYASGQGRLVRRPMIFESLII